MSDLAQLQVELAQTQQENARLRAENHALTRGAATAVTESANARLALRALERETQACYRCNHTNQQPDPACGCCGNEHNGFPESDPEDQVPAESQAQRAYLNAKFGHAWVKQHHFDNPGKLPAHVKKKRSPVLEALMQK